MLQCTLLFIIWPSPLARLIQYLTDKITFFKRYVVRSVANHSFFFCGFISKVKTARKVILEETSGKQREQRGSLASVSSWAPSFLYGRHISGLNDVPSSFFFLLLVYTTTALYVS